MSNQTMRRQIEEVTEKFPNCTSGEIAKIVGCYASYVRTVWHLSRRPSRSPAYRRHRQAHVMVHVPISHEFYNWLFKEARKHGVDVDTFAGSILNDGIADVMGGSHG